MTTPSTEQSNAIKTYELLPEVVKVLKIQNGEVIHTTESLGLHVTPAEEWNSIEGSTRVFGTTLDLDSITRTDLDPGYDVAIGLENNPDYATIVARFRYVFAKTIPLDFEPDADSIRQLQNSSKSCRLAVLQTYDTLLSGEVEGKQAGSSLDHQIKTRVLQEGIVRDTAFYACVAAAVSLGNFEAAIQLAKRSEELKITGANNTLELTVKMINAASSTFSIEKQVSSLQELSQLPGSQSVPEASNDLRVLESSAQRKLEAFNRGAYETSLSVQKLTSGLSVEVQGQQLENSIIERAKGKVENPKLESEAVLKEMVALTDSHIAAEFGDPLVGMILADALTSNDPAETAAELLNPTNGLDAISLELRNADIANRRAIVTRLTTEDSIREFLNSPQFNPRLASPRILVTILRNHTHLETVLNELDPKKAENVRNTIRNLTGTLSALKNISHDRESRRIVSHVLGLNIDDKDETLTEGLFERIGLKFGLTFEKIPVTRATRVSDMRQVGNQISTLAYETRTDLLNNVIQDSAIFAEGATIDSLSTPTTTEQILPKNRVSTRVSPFVVYRPN